MTKYPQTKEEAQTFRYGKWAGNPTGNAWKPECCAEGVWGTGRGALLHQCNSKPGHGPDGLYCSRHAIQYDTSEGEEWFRTSSGIEIVSVRAAKSTDSKIWIKRYGGNVQQENKRSQWYNYHPSREEAIAFLRTRTENGIRSAKFQLEQLQRTLEKINSL